MSNKLTPSHPSSSSSYTKLILLAILALLFLNLNASSVILSSSLSSSSPRRRRKQQSSSLRKRPNKQKKQQQWKVLEQYEDFEEFDASAYSEDGNDARDSLPDADSVVVSADGKELLTTRPISSDATEVTDSEEMEEGSFDEQLLRKVKERGGNMKKGKIAWLMSFPNSGTSFTSLLIRHASNATTATNYGMESNIGMDGKSVPVYDWSMEGPYWLHPPQKLDADDDATTKKSNDAKEDDYQSGTKLGKSGTYETPPISASIMTKTHCGSRCAFCHPKRYLETSSSFLKQCLTGSRKVPIQQPGERQSDGRSAKHKNQSKYKKLYTTYYHPALVEKAVHLIRNPFDNIVSRFHHEQKEHKKKGNDGAKWTSRYTNDVTGLKKWCADEDALYAEAEASIDWKAWGYPADITRYFEGVSCHGEFFRYVQWHVMAVRAVELLGIPVLYVYYEDYSTDLKGSTEEMLDFLSLDRVGTLPSFDSNKDYSAYFSREERASASDMMRRVASVRGRDLLERYWVELDFEKLKRETKSIK
ncbi:hypothetical protein ACHAXR_008249 [Thalassiosira sp. AJA248-18]